MKKCPSCGHDNPLAETKCPQCGAYYSKIIELIDKEAADEEQSSLQGRFRRIAETVGVKQALRAELKRFVAELSPKAKFTLFVSFVFVFALVVSVL